MRRFNARWHFGAVLWLGLVLGSTPTWANAQIQRLSIQTQGHTWTYQLYVPERTPPLGAPLVLVFHGAGGSGQDMLVKNGWIALSEQKGFAVVAPDGLPAMPRMPSNFRFNPRLWNAGQLAAQSPRAKIDDIAFVHALLDDVAARTAIDAKHIFVTGHSNGAGMAYKVAAEMSTRFAGLAAVMGLNTVEGAKPVRALPSLALLGTLDPLNPLQGGERTLPWGKSVAPAVAQGIGAWSQSLGCTAPATQERDDETATVMRFANCSDAATYTVWYLKGQGHAWPGGQGSGLPDSMMGPNTTPINATQLIGSFFETLVPQ